MSSQMDYIKEAYNLPFLKKGLPVELDGKKGIVHSARGPHVMVKFEGDKFPKPCHPTWNMKYFTPDMETLND